MVSIRQGYLVSYIVSTNFVMLVSYFSSYCVNSNHFITEMMISTDFINILFFISFTLYDVGTY